MALFNIFYKRVGVHRNIPRTVEAKDIKNIEGPMRENIAFMPGYEQVTITIDEEPDAEGVYSGKLDYGLKGEFTITPL
jgi:hypothetical protein